VTDKAPDDTGIVNGLLIAVATAAGLAGACYLGLWLFAWVLFGPVTSTSRYEEIISSYETVYPHFPKKINPTARDVEFRYEPGFGQGGPNTFLKMQLPEGNFRQVLSELENKDGVREASESDKLFLAGFYPETIHGKDWQAAQEEFMQYRVFLFDEPAFEEGYYLYVAVKPESREVLYFGTIAR